MKTITVSKADLIAKLTENRAKHQQEFDASYHGWVDKVIEAMRTGLEEFKREHDTSNLNVGYRLAKPENHVDEYDRALQMLEWETADQISLSEDDFRHLVQDDWDWSRAHRAFTSQYIAS